MALSRVSHAAKAVSRAALEQMQQAIEIVFAALFTYFVCQYAGRFLLGQLRVELYDSERRFFGFVLGAATLSMVVFCLAALRLAYTPVFLLAGIALIFLGARTKIVGRGPLPPLPALWRVAFWTIFVAFSVLYLSNALAPETSPDGTAYHLAFVARYFREHRLTSITTNIFGSLSQGIEMLFLFAFAFGRHSAAAMVHFLFLLLLPFGMLSYAKRFNIPVAGVVGSLIFFVTPIVGRTGTVAYVDIAVAYIAFAVFYLLQIWRDESQAALLVPIGLLAGFAYGTKYTAFIVVPYALGYLAIHLWQRKQPVLRPIILTTFCAFLMMAPWMIKNTIVVRNPFSPFANQYFRNPYVYVSAEKDLARAVRNFNQVRLAEVPLEATVHGFRLLGLIGPVFLLSPLILLSLRHPQGRQLVPAAIIFLLPYFANIGARFLIPCLPFVSLSLGLLVVRWRPAALAILLVHSVLSWPNVVGLYAHQYAWRLERFDWSAALRLIPEEEVLRQRVAQYEVGLMLGKYVPKDEPVFAPSGCQSAYHDRDVIEAYKSALGYRLRDVLWSAIFEGMKPTWRHEYAFPEVDAHGLRLVQTGETDNEQEIWSVSELRVFRGQEELKRQADWRFDAWPNPWEVQLAFDSNPITRWRSWETRRPGMYIMVDFGTTQKFDRIVIDSSHDQGPVTVQVEYKNPSGRWRTLAANVKVRDIAVPAASLHQAAGLAMRAGGIHWLLLRKGEWGYDDVVQHQEEWGLVPVAKHGDYTLYRLRPH